MAKIITSKEKKENCANKIAVKSAQIRPITAKHIV